MRKQRDNNCSNKSDRRRLTEKELADLLPKELIFRYSQLRSTRYTFAGNYRELKELVVESEQRWFELPVRDPVTLYSPEVSKRLLEISRLLHNFLSVAMSLKDHTNRVVDQVFTEALFQPYERRVKTTFTDEPVARFVQELRNYSLHRNLPLAGARTTLQNNAPVTTLVTLNKQILLEGKKWKEGRKYLEIFDHEVPVGQFVDDYYNIVKTFHQWLETYFFTTYAQVVDYQQKLEIENIKQTIPESALQEFIIRQLTTQNSDNLIDDKWTFDIS